VAQGDETSLDLGVACQAIGFRERIDRVDRSSFAKELVASRQL
jgi:hypothetical protein